MSHSYKVIDDLATIDLSKRDPAAQSAVLVDFDHTMFAANSTELFITTCKPTLLIAVVEFLVRRCIPWRFVCFHDTGRLRDFLCVWAIIVVSPWNVFRWRRIAPRLFERNVSPRVVEIMLGVKRERLVIISFGFQFIIGPLLRKSNWQSVKLIATPLCTAPVYFRRGKRDIVAKHMGLAEIAAATFISDSLDDKDLLEAVATGYLIKPEGTPFRALQRLYLPFRYTAAAKYTLSYVIDQFGLVEYILILIAVSDRFSALRAAFIPVALLYISVMCIYEIGYFENDMVAARHEDVPTLASGTSQFRFYPISIDAWILAVVFGILGAQFARKTDPFSDYYLILDILQWIISMISLRIVYYFYNKPDLKRRLLLYPALQSLKFLPIFLMISPTDIGVIAVLAHIATMSAVYITYRQGGQTQSINRETYRVVLIVIGVCLVLTHRSILEPGTSFQIAALVIWSTGRLVKAAMLRLLRRR